MTEEAEILTAEFPTAVRGYSKVAVDDFVRVIGNRLQAMQALLDEKTEMVEARTEALDKMRGDLAAFSEKEAAITKAYLSVEQRRVDVDKELERQRADASVEINSSIEAAQTEAEGILAVAQKRADEMQSLAEAACALQMKRLTELRGEYDGTVAEIRRALEAHLALLPPADGDNAPADIALTTATATTAISENGWVAPVEAVA